MSLLGQKICCVLLAAMLVSCGGGGEATPSSDLQISPAKAGTTTTSAILSVQTGISYDLKIWLPAGYAEGTAKYPVIYAMDCEYRFDTLMSVMQRVSTQAILVNVCAMGSARRWVDFTLPGAAPYFQFLTRELVPSIDASLRTEPSKRTLSGHSLSAQFVLYALYFEDPAKRYFTAIISEDCTCWGTAAQTFTNTQPTDLEDALFNATHRLPIRLVMAQDAPINNQSWPGLAYDRIVSRNYLDLQSTFNGGYNLGHVPMDGPAFRDALDFVYGRQ